MTRPSPAVPFTIRRAEPSDWQHVRNVRLAMLLDSPRAYGSTYARDAALTDADWQGRVGPQAHPTWLAWSGSGPQRPLGSVTALVPRGPDDRARLVGMWVSPEARGSGLGAALLTQVVAHLRDETLADLLFLDVADENAGASRLYRRAGFLPTGQTGWLPSDPAITESELALPLRPGVEVPVVPAAPPRPCT